MATEEQLSQLRQAYDNGTLDKSTYETMLKALGIDVVDIKDSQIGIIGNNATVRDINIYPPDKDSPAESISTP